MWGCRAKGSDFHAYEFMGCRGYIQFQETEGVRGLRLMRSEVPSLEVFIQGLGFRVHQQSPGLNPKLRQISEQTKNLCLHRSWQCGCNIVAHSSIRIGQTPPKGLRDLETKRLVKGAQVYRKPALYFVLDPVEPPKPEHDSVTQGLPLRAPEHRIC